MVILVLMIVFSCAVSEAVAVPNRHFDLVRNILGASREPTKEIRSSAVIAMLNNKDREIPAISLNGPHAIDLRMRSGFGERVAMSILQGDWFLLQ
jgi:hypothetical protein